MLFADSRSVLACAITSRHVCFLYGIHSRKLRAKVIVQQEDKLWEGTVKSWSSAKLCRRFGRKL